MNVGGRGLLPLLALLYAASYWGFVWYPIRWLEGLGMEGLWQTLVSYSAALALITLLRGLSLKPLAGQGGNAFWLSLASGWTNVAFVLAVIDGEVVRVLILFYLSPLWAALLGRWLLAEPIRTHTGIMLTLGLSGAVVMLWQPGMLDAPVARADWLALSAGIGFALTNVMTRRIQGVSDRLKTQLAWAGVVAVSGLWLLARSGPVPDVAYPGWLGALALGILGFFFATLAVVYAVSRMPIQRSSVIMLFEILVGAVSSWLLAGEVIEWREWLGGALIIGAGLVAVSYRTDGSESSRDPDPC
jgi:drug/metabolite transporter (DMT)-like permease